jgi:hypothetical protein
MLRVKIGFGEGSLEYYTYGERLQLRGLNNIIELRPRSLFIGKAKSREDGLAGKRRYIYIYPPEPLKPLPMQPMIGGRGLGRTSIRGFEVRYAETPIGFFHTIILPGWSLLDYLIVADDQFAVAVSGKKEVYYDVEDDSLTVYVV